MEFVAKRAGWTRQPGRPVRAGEVLLASVATDISVAAALRAQLSCAQSSRQWLQGRNSRNSLKTNVRRVFYLTITRAVCGADYPRPGVVFSALRHNWLSGVDHE
jgi:hypothetical protein